MVIKYYIIIILFLFFNHVSSQKVNEINHDFEFNIQGDNTYFFNKKKIQVQKNNYNSMSLELNYNIKFRKSSLKFTPFIRFDYDNNRNNLDVRELNFEREFNKFTFNLGVNEIFWGVMESNNLVDIINQTNIAEKFNGKSKLGQPMVNFNFNLKKYGKLNLYYLPYHRKRIFPGVEGRLNPFLINDNTLYESSKKEWNPDFSMRWQFSKKQIDVGLSFFKGNGREPVYDLNVPVLVYPLIEQYGFEFQFTKNSFLWKAESIYRHSKLKNVFAFAIGGEYTIGNIFSNIDLSFFYEYSFDDRNQFSTTTLDNDVFLAAKISFNDVNNSFINIGIIKDLKLSSLTLNVELNRKVSKNISLKIESNIFKNINRTDLFLRNLENDSFAKLNVSYSF